MTAGSISYTRGEDPLRADKLNASFSERLLVAGDTMTGPLILSRDPLQPFEAATKQYLDAQVTNRLTGFLSTTGGTLTGFLTLNANPVNPLHAATKQYVDNSAFLPLAGGTLTGLLTVGLNAAGGAEMRINSAAGTTRYLSYATAGQMRWRAYASLGAESGSNVGSDYTIDRFNDAGTLLGTALTIARNTGIATFGASPLAPTPIVGDNSTKLATTAFVAGQIVAAGAITEAPVDGKTYGRQSSAWTEVATKPYTDAVSSSNVGRNLLHNPLFQIVQRGIGPFTVNGYAQDRWRIEANLDAMTLSNAAAPDFMRTQIGDEAAAVFAAFGVTGNAGAAAYSVFNQRIEDVRRLGGKTVTVSFWAVLNAGATKIGVSIDQNFGSGGSPSAPVSPAGQSVTLSTTWTRYSLTFTMPSIIGKTLGTNGDSYTALYFWFSSGATQNARAGGIGVQTHGPNLWGIQLEIGSVATPLEKPDPQQDLAKCQRFYQVGPFRFVAYQGAGNGFGIAQPLIQTMRASPTLVPSYTAQTNCTGALAVLDPATIYVVGTATALGSVALTGTYTVSADL